MKEPSAPRAAGGLRVVPVLDQSALVAVSEEWSALLARSASNRPTQAPFWLLAWWRVFGGSLGRHLATALLFDGSRLVGVAPLQRHLRWHRGLIPFRSLNLLATGEPSEDEVLSDYLGVIAERGYEEAVAESLAVAIARGTLGPVDELVLSMLDGALSINDALATSFRSQGYTVERQELSPSPYIRLPATWNEYLSALSGSGRYLVTRSLRDFERWAGGESDLARVTTMAELEEGKRILISQHGERWRSSGQSGVFASRAFTGFHDAVLPRLLEAGALELTWLRVRGEPVAVSYSIVWDNKVLFYQGGRTMDVPKGVRPGIALHARNIQAAIEAGRSEYDFLPGDSQYKLQLATDAHAVLRLRASRAPLRDAACVLVERGVVAVRAARARAKAGSHPQ
ncbi:MAG TPA: GNAT family N-acetyltransferase [Polyangia bacterium]|jgi:CelD/BcsL family acetyltransferase involved in cellulose biosynthesis|nr:GNAT family N-acetyltransferase [Polyangia bacterium]